MGIKWYIFHFNILLTSTSLSFSINVYFLYWFPNSPASLSWLPIQNPSCSVDKIISKQILGMLWGKYNSASYSQLLDHAAKDNPEWPYGNVVEKALVFTSWTENLDLCLMWIPLQWCNKNFYSKTPLLFFSSFLTRPPPLPLSCMHLYPS